MEEGKEEKGLGCGAEGGCRVSVSACAVSFQLLTNRRTTPESRV